MKFPTNKYLDATKKAMNMLAKENTIFIGQTVEYEGSAMYRSLIDIPKNKKIELPVAEDMQMGMSIGLSLEGFIPVSIFPRMDFLICAMNQLVNHLDKVEKMSNGEFKPGVIIRTQIGNTKPLYPGPQHCGNYYDGINRLCKKIMVAKLMDTREVEMYYQVAYERAKQGKSSILIEMPQGK